MTRDEILKQIRFMGYDVVDHAEDILGDGEYARNIEIVLRLDNECVPTITVKREYLSIEALRVRRREDDTM